MGKQTSFTTIRYALLNNRVNVYGIVDSFEKSNGSLLVQLKDETGKFQIVVDKEASLPFTNLQRGDILRCFHLKKSEGRGIFDSSDRKIQIVVYSGGSNTFIPKFCTSNTGGHVDHKRITDLRAITLQDLVSEKDREFSNHREKVFLALACGLTPPSVPDSIRENQELFTQIRVQDSPTLKSLSEVTARHISNNLTKDRFFNFFCQVLSVHKAGTGYVICGWDGSDTEELVSGLATVESLGICEDIVPYCHSEEVVKRTVNIMFYGNSWKSQMMQLNEKDVILVANAHINTRQLGEKILAMHEGQEFRRALLVVPNGHLAAERLLQRCNGILTGPKALTQRVAPSQTVMGDINALLATQTSIQEWQPTQTEIVPNQELIKRDLNTDPLTQDKSQRKVSFACEQEIVMESAEEEMETDDDDPGQGEVEWIDQMEQRLPQTNESLIETMSSRAVNLLPSHISFKSELTTLLQLPKGQIYNFSRPIRVNKPLWRMLVHSEMSHLYIDQDSEEAVLVPESIQSIHFLVPVENEQNEVVIFALALETLRQIYVNHFPGSLPQISSVEMKSWIRDISNFLMTNFEKDKIFVSASLFRAFKDGSILRVRNLYLNVLQHDLF